MTYCISLWASAPRSDCPGYRQLLQAHVGSKWVGTYSFASESTYPCNVLVQERAIEADSVFAAFREFRDWQAGTDSRRRGAGLMIELQDEYIRDYISYPTIHAEVEVLVEEDYNPETDGFLCNIVKTSSPLSLPMDASGADSISRLGHDLAEAIDKYKLRPGTRYLITMVRCSEPDGCPHMMETWAVLEVCMSDLYDPKLQPPSPAGGERCEEGRCQKFDTRASERTCPRGRCEL